MRQTYTPIRLVLISTFFVLAIGLFFWFDTREKANIQQNLEITTERYQLAYNTIYNQYKQLATNIHLGMLSRYDISGTYKKLLTADVEKKNKLRKELLQKINPRYQEIRQNGKLRQLHFHLPNNESFLRFHKPTKFGDDLTEARPTVDFVNKEHSTIDGFEEGKIYNGYRFVFPIKDKNNQHLGSMEVSFGPEAFALSLIKQYGVFSNFYIKKSVSEKKVFVDDLGENYTQSNHEDYLYDNQVLLALNKLSDQNTKILLQGKTITKHLVTNALNDTPMSLYDTSIKKIITTIPVINPVNHKKVAFFAIYSKSPIIEKDIQYFKIAFSLSCLLLVLVCFIIYQQYCKKKILHTSKEQLEVQEERLLEAQRIANIGHWDFDIRKKSLNISEQVYHILGPQSEKQLSSLEDCWENVHPEDQVYVKSAYLNALSTSSAFDIQHRIITTDRNEKWVRHLCTITSDKQGTPLRSFGVIHDITIQKVQEDLQLQVIRQQEELKRVDSLKRMAGAIAHRFNNEMAVVMGNLEFVIESLPEHSDDHETSSIAFEAAVRASQLGSMMLNYVGQQSLALEDSSLNEIVEESIAELKDILKPSISLNLTSPNKIIQCSVDRRQIKEVFRNILTNAAESLEDGAGTIEITFGTGSFTTDLFPVIFQNNSTDSDKYVFCQIKDSGHGISQENMSRIFEPFYTTKFEGRGLGLALTVGAMQAHHGAIIIDSVLHQETTVKVLLPLEKISI